MAASRDDTIYVGGLPTHFDDEKLAEIFATFGPIKKAEVVRWEYGGDVGMSRGYGFVTFESRDSARHAFGLDGKKGLKVGPYTGHYRDREASPPHAPRQGRKKSRREDSPSRSERAERRRKLRKLESEAGETNSSIYVLGLCPDAMETNLIDSHFSKFGPIHSIRLLYKPSEEDRNEGIAKIRFMEKWQAAEAILDFDGTKWKGAKLRCEWWNKRRREWIDENILRQCMEGVRAEQEREGGGDGQGTVAGTSATLASEEETPLWLPKTKRWIPPIPKELLPKKPMDGDGEEEEPSPVKELSELFKREPNLPTIDRAKMMLKLLNSLKGPSDK